MIPEFPELMDLLACEAATSLSGKHIYYLERRELFPKRVKLGRRSAWVRAEVRAWIAERISARGGVVVEQDSACPPRDVEGRFTSIEDPKAKACRPSEIKKPFRPPRGSSTKSTAGGKPA